jgi:glycosyltransferase involved in cell wall biosynthesis
MKIAFLCGCLEPGRDGVGDYTRKLASQLVQQGHTAVLVALNDNYVQEATHETQVADGTVLPTLRLPTAWPIEQRMANAKIWLDTVDPEVLSLQFVLFSFHPKGLPYGLAPLLAKLGQGRTWHLMFHELWVGMATNDTLKRKVWGRLQESLIKGLIKQLKPALIHTQCSLYFAQLTKAGQQVAKLPLFSNIEQVASAPGAPYLYKEELDTKRPVRFIFFGGLHPEAKLKELIEALQQFYHHAPLAFEFIYAGRNGQELDYHLPVLKELNVTYQVFGELSPAEISQLLAGADFGVSTGSPEMLEKNGTVAAMLLHGLPTLCIGRSLLLKNLPPVPMMPGTYRLADLPALLTKRPAIAFAHTLPAVAKLFERDLLSTR